MKHFLVVILLFTFLISKAQNYTGNFTFRTILYSFKSEKQESSSFKIYIEETDANKSDFILKPLKLETFDVVFKTKLVELLPSDKKVLTDAEEKEIAATSRSLFYSIVAESLKESISNAPLAGKLTISNEVTLYKIVTHEKKDKVDSIGTVIIQDIEIEFYESFIETIKVTGEIKITGSSTRKGRFENQYGIGFASRRNFQKLNDISLYDAKSAENVFINLGELLDYDYSVKSMTRDFSPANQVISSFGGQKIELKKEETSKLFEAKVFSDFLGIDKEKPNGLIQTEISKRINLSPERFQTWHYTRWLSQGFGFFQYVQPALTISKIEENNRFLEPRTNDTIVKLSSGIDSLNQNNSTSPIQILYYQNLSLGLDLNILFLDNSNMKYHFYLNTGFRFGRTAIRDSSRTLSAQNQIIKSGNVNEFGVNYFTFYPEAVLQFLPEERFSVTITDRLQYFSSAFNEPKLQINSNGSKTNRWINLLEIAATVKTGENGKLFARWRFNSEIKKVEENFHQIQLGYSFYILRKN